MRLLNIGNHFFNEERAILRYLKREYKHIPILDYNNIQGDSNKVWLFWAQGIQNMPKKVIKCIDSIKRNNRDLEVIVLDKNNVSNYVTIPQYILEKRLQGKITWTHFSDILRFSLLEKYGGWWIDATIYLTDHLPKKRELFTIRRYGKNGTIANGDWCGFLWYMPAHHPLSSYANAFLNEYWSRNEELIAYFLIDHIIRIYYSKCRKFKLEIEKIKPSCPNLFFFQSEECENKFDENTWNELISSNLFFKTDWRSNHLLSDSNGNKSYYGHIFG